MENLPFRNGSNNEKKPTDFGIQFGKKLLCMWFCLRPGSLLKKKLWHRRVLENFVKFL